MTDIRLSGLRGKAQRLYREYAAILILTNQVTVQTKGQLDSSKAYILRSNKSELRELIQQLEEKIPRLRQEFGVISPRAELIRLSDMAEATPHEKPYLLIPKYLLQAFFSHYERALPRFPVLPMHAQICIDAGKHRVDQGAVEYCILEAALFEDMCALFNLIKRHNELSSEPNALKKQNKITSALSRSTVATAFHFVEGYLNGIAFEHYVLNESSLDDKTKILLTEWDHVRNRAAFQSLKEKALKYPRIAKGEEQPLLQESNCPELSLILGEAKVLRDSIVHASPKYNLETFEAKKLNEFFDIDLGRVERMVDAAIGLVRKLEVAIKGNDRRLFWLHCKGEDGSFPDAVFQ